MRDFVNRPLSVYNYQKRIQDHMFVGPRIRRFLVDSGFVEVNTDYVSLPLCWGGFVGKNTYEVSRRIYM